MANVTVYNMEGNEVGTMELNDAVFGVEINEHLVHLAVVRQLANNRQGTQKAKTRSEVRGGGRKPWRRQMGHSPEEPRQTFRPSLRKRRYGTGNPGKKSVHFCKT